MNNERLANLFAAAKNVRCINILEHIEFNRQDINAPLKYLCVSNSRQAQQMGEYYNIIFFINNINTSSVIFLMITHRGVVSNLIYLSSLKQIFY